MELAGCDMLEHDGEISSQLGRARSVKRGVLRQAQFIHTVSIETGAAALAVNAARFDFAQVGQ
jgi:hypothetical protein